MQEDKERVFDALDTVKACLGIMEPMLATTRVNREQMRTAAERGYINATDLADYLTSRGMPFRDAYKLVGRIVSLCMEAGETLESLPLETYQDLSPLFDETLYAAISLDACVARRTSEGGCAPDSVMKQVAEVRSLLKKLAD